MAGHAPYNYINTMSIKGQQAPAYVDIPSVNNGQIAIVRSLEVFIGTNNGKKKLSAKYINITRYPKDIDGADRDNAEALSSFRIMVSGEKQNSVSYIKANERYNLVEGLEAITGLGFRVSLNNKDRSSDEQFLSVGYEVLSAQNLI